MGWTWGPSEGEAAAGSWEHILFQTEVLPSGNQPCLMENNIFQLANQQFLMENQPFLMEHHNVQWVNQQFLMDNHYF